jgi:serine/threonine-protein kinase RsbT
MIQQSFSELDQQKVIVSVMETTRNVLDHGGGKGVFLCESLDRGICFQVIDYGGGIADLGLVLEGKKRSSSRGLGLGLVGAKRLMDDFHIESSLEGTKIIAKKWIKGKWTTE